MAGSRVPGGSLRAHASNTSKAKSSNIFGSVKSSAPKKFDSKKANDSSDSDSDDSSSSSDASDSDIGTTSLADIKKLTQTPASQKKTPVAKSKESAKAAQQATPSKPSTNATINGLASSIKKEKASQPNIKKEATSSSEEESSSESEDEKPKKVVSKEVAIKKSDSSSESESESESESDSDSDTSSAGAKVASSTKAAPPAATKNVKAESSSSESDSDSESESEDESAKAKDVVGKQKKADTKPKAITQVEPAPSEKASKPSKKAKASKAAPEDEVDEDGDVEMVDQSTALTNGGKPTQVGDVPEFVAPDFHLRKLEGSANAADVATFFTKAQLEGKQVWYITAPASLPVTVVQDLTIPMDQAQKGLPVLSHNGDDYRMAFDNPAASSSFRLLIPNKNGDEYSLLERPVNQSMHFTRSETFPPGGPGSLVTTTQTVSTTKPARPQPKGLRARYTPLGVPTPKPTLTAPPASASKGKGKAAAASTTPAATPSKKKRKHRDDGEDGPVATAIHDTPVVSSSSKGEPANKKAKNAVKNTPAEKSNKKQKTSKSKDNENEEQQQQHQSPVMTKKQTPIPLPQIPSFTTSASVSDADNTASNTKAETKTKTPKKQEEAKSKGKGKKKSEKPVVVKTEEKTPKKVSQILPPRFDSRGQPLH